MMKWFFSESRNLLELSTPTRRQRRRRLVMTRTSWDDDVSGDDTDSTFKQEFPVILELQHPTKNAEIKDMVPFLSPRHVRRPRHRRMPYLRQQHHSTTSGGDDDDTVNTSSTLALIDVPNDSVECSKGTCGVCSWMDTFDRQVSNRGQEFLSSPSCLGATSLPCSTTPIDAALLIPAQGHSVVDVATGLPASSSSSCRSIPSPKKHYHVSFRLELNVSYDAPSPLVHGFSSTSSSSYNDDDDDNDDNDDGHPPSLWYNGLHLRSMERHVRAKVDQLLEYDTIQLLYGNDKNDNDNDSTDHSIDKEEDSLDSTHEDEEDDNTMTMDHDNDWFHKHRHHFHRGVNGRYKKTRLSCSKSTAFMESTNHDRCCGCNCSSIVRMWRHILERCSRPNICHRHEANFFHHVLLPEQQAFLIAWTQSSNLGFERWIVARIQASAAKATYSSSSSSTIVMTSSTGGGTIHHHQTPPCGAVVAGALNSTITSRQQLVQVVLGLQSVMREEVKVAVAACSNSNTTRSTTMPTATTITDTTTTTTTEKDDILVADHGRELLEQQACCCLQQSSQRLSRPSRRLALCIAMAQHEQAVFL